MELVGGLVGSRSRRVFSAFPFLPGTVISHSSSWNRANALLLITARAWDLLAQLLKYVPFLL